MKGDLKILCQFNGKSSNLMGYLWQATVKKMLADIQARGEEGALDWAKKLDGEDDEDTGGMIALLCLLICMSTFVF